MSEQFLEDDGVAQFRDSGEHEHAGEAVMNQLGEQLKDAENTHESVRLMGDAASALRELASESDDPQAVTQRAKDECGDVARRSGKKKDQFVGLIDDATQDVLDERRRERVTSGEGLGVPEGTGLDEYLENELVEVVRQRSTDAVDDPVLRWRFADGVRIETSESIHHDHYALFKKLATATDERLVPELASEQIEDELRDDEDTDGEVYARLSLGPESRPWNTDSNLWSRAISGLVEDRRRTETVVGPRTDAWESIQARIRSGRAVRDLADAVAHGMIHVDEDDDEVWIPTTIVDNAADTVETSRRALQAELAERGVTSANLSGSRVSEAVSRGATALRFWRLDMTHDEVPKPEAILDEIQDPIDARLGGGDGGGGGGSGTGTAAADGGGEAYRGTERFGRPADDDSGGGDGATDADTDEDDKDESEAVGEDNADSDDSTAPEEDTSSPDGGEG